MPRYIDADALRERMYHEAFETDSKDQRWDSGCWIRYKMFERNIEAIPTADVVEVKRGTWIDDWEMGCSECSVCSDSYLWEDFKGVSEWNFCPNCGAKMDKEGDNDVI